MPEQQTGTGVSLARRRPKQRQDRSHGRERRWSQAEATSALDEALRDHAIYVDGRRLDEVPPLGHARAVARSRGGYVWADLHHPSAEAVEEVGAAFELHELALEDAIHAHQRPKLDVFENGLLVVLKAAQYRGPDRELRTGEVMLFLADDYVVTLQHGEATTLDPVRRDIDARPDIARLGPAAVLWAVADRVVDDLEAVVDHLADDVERVEAEVFSSEAGNAAERIYLVKREVLRLRRALGPLAAPLERLAESSAPLLPAETRPYFRDVLDHVLRATERVQGFDQLLSDALNANLAQLTVRDNSDMRRISAWVAILAVPTMVFGIYGMNFDHMPELRWEGGYPLILGVVIAVCTALYVRFRRTGWL